MAETTGNFPIKGTDKERIIVEDEKRLKILFIPTWYPGELNPVAGILIKEHARAASLYNDIVVLYAYSDPSPKLSRLYQISEGIEDGIRTIRVKYIYYEGIFTYIKRLLFKDRSKKQPPSSSTTNKLLSILRTPFKIPRVVIRESLYYYSIFAAFRRLVKEGWKPDIIHAHVFTAAVPAVLLGKLYRIPVVITERFSSLALHKLSFLERVKSRFAMNRAQMILPVSYALKEAIEAYGVRNEFQVIPNVVNTELFYPPSPGNQRGDTKRILMVGNLIPIKGIPYLLQALAQIRERREDFTLDIIGDGANRSEYEELIKDLGLEDVVDLHGPKLKEEMPEFMRSCDFLVLPSLYETFGAVIIEALACGKPVVASNIGGIAETVNENSGILVPPGDVARLQQAIEFMLDHYVDYPPEELSTYAKERFDYESGGQLLNDIYRRVKGRRSSGSGPSGNIDYGLPQL